MLRPTGGKVKVRSTFSNAHSGSKVYSGWEWEGREAGRPIRRPVMVNPQAHISLGCNYLFMSVSPREPELFNEEIDGSKLF